jgi:hypothetical protein
MSLKRTNFDLNAFCDLPQVRRVHQAIAVALAVFLLTVIVLRTPFRGYLAEVHITGPATAGLDLDDAVQWLKRAEPRLAAVATPAGEYSAKCEIRATYVASRAQPALLHLDELADSWLYQYLPDRLQSHRRAVLAKLRATVNAARQDEDAAQAGLEALRQKQVAVVQVASAKREPEAVLAHAVEEKSVQKPAETSNATAISAGSNSEKALEVLRSLRMELSNLLASHTDEHPEIVRLKSRINALERQLGLSSEASVPAGTESGPAAGQRQVQLPDIPPAAVKQTSGETHEVLVTQLATEIAAVANDLTEASRRRQMAEQHLTERMQELSSEPTAAQWSAGPAHLVTRLGGTPRLLTVGIASVLALVAGATMFRATAVNLIQPKIEFLADLTDVLELPVVGDLGVAAGLENQNSDGTPKMARPLMARVVTPGNLRLVTYGAEALVAVAAGACLLSVAIDPPLARQVLTDPFGTLAEVMGRFGA